MKLQKKYLMLLYKVLDKCDSLNLAEARVRDYFIKSLVSNIQDFAKDEETIFNTFGNKNKDGKAIRDEKGQFFFSDLSEEKLQELNQELQTLYSEEATMVGMEKIADIIEKTSYSPLKGEALDIDTIISCIKGTYDKGKGKESTDTKTEKSSSGTGKKSLTKGA